MNIRIHINKATLDTKWEIATTLASLLNVDYGFNVIIEHRNTIFRYSGTQCKNNAIIFTHKSKNKQEPSCNGEMKHAKSTILNRQNTTLEK